MTRLVYLSDARLPSRSTNAMQVMQMCSAFDRVGLTVTLVHPRVPAPEPEGYGGDLWSFYGIDQAFSIVGLPAFPSQALTIDSPLQRGARSIGSALYALSRSRPGAAPFFYYARSTLGAWFATRARSVWGSRSACRAFALELHDEPTMPSLLQESDIVYTITGALAARIVELRPDVRTRIRVEPDGVDLRAIRPQLLDRQAARRRLGIENIAGPVIVYTGRVNREKGAGIAVEAMDFLGDVDARLILVGKVYDAEIGRRCREGGVVTCVGFVPPASVAGYVAAADVVLLPTTPSLPYAAFTSPLKLFEYMASGRPIVAADLPVLREVLTHDRNALLYPATDSRALAAAVKRAWHDRELATRLWQRAFEDVQRYSWDERARRIAADLSRVAAVQAA